MNDKTNSPLGLPGRLSSSSHSSDRYLHSRTTYGPTQGPLKADSRPTYGQGALNYLHRLAALCAVFCVLLSAISLSSGACVHKKKVVGKIVECVLCTCKHVVGGVYVLCTAEPRYIVTPPMVNLCV